MRLPQLLHAFSEEHRARLLDRLRDQALRRPADERAACELAASVAAAYRDLPPEPPRPPPAPPALAPARLPAPQQRRSTPRARTDSAKLRPEGEHASGREADRDTSPGMAALGDTGAAEGGRGEGSAPGSAFSGAASAGDASSIPTSATGGAASTATSPSPDALASASSSTHGSSHSPPPAPSSTHGPSPSPPAVPSARERVLAALHLDRVARALVREPRPVEAMVAWQQAFSLAPQAQFLRGLLGAARAASHHDDALIVLEQLLTLETVPSRRRELLLERARLLEERLRRFSAAADAYADGVAELEDDPEFLSGLSRCLEAARRYEELLAVSRRLLQLEKSEGQLALLHTRVANLLQTLGGDPEEAMAHYQHALHLTPSFEPPAQGLLALAEKRGQWRLVAETLKTRLKAERRPKERATILTRLAEVTERHLRAPATGVAYLERAIREYPRGLSARLLLLEILCARGEFARAERFATPPDSTDAHGLSPEQLARLAQIRARVSAEQGRPEEAIECLGVALEVASAPEPLVEDVVALVRRYKPETAPPDSLLRVAKEHEDGAKRLSGLAWLAHALLLHGLGQVDAALHGYERAVALWPAPTTFEALGELHLSLRRFDRAAQAFADGARQSQPPHAPLLTRAARVLADHLGRPADALAMLGELPAQEPEPLLLAASLALQQGDLEHARRCLESARTTPGLSPDRFATLWLSLQRRTGDAAAVADAEQQAAAAGEPVCLRAAVRRSLEGAPAALPLLLQALPAARQPLGHRLAGDARRLAGQKDAAVQHYREAIRLASEPAPLEALEGLALVAPDVALTELERRLVKAPFELHALSLLSTLLSATGSAHRAQRLYQLARFIQDGELQAPGPAPDRFWALARFEEPLGRLLAHLRRALPTALATREALIAGGATSVELPAAAQETLRTLCAARGLPVPSVLAHPHVGSRPVALGTPFAVVVSHRLLAPRMPAGALWFSVLRALATLGADLHAMSYLASYELDTASEALRLLASPNPGGGSAAELLADALEVTEDDVRPALASLQAPTNPHAVDPLAARAEFDNITLRAALAGSGDLIGALTALSLRPPPNVAWRTTRTRWLRLLDRLPSARIAFGYTLAEDLAA